MAYPTGSIPFTGIVGTTNISDTYPVTTDELNLGGHRAVADNTARDAITTDRRRFGMLVTTQDQNPPVTYILCDITMGGTSNTLSDNTNWIPLPTGSSLSLTTTGSGAATYVSGILNIPTMLLESNLDAYYGDRLIPANTALNGYKIAKSINGAVGYHAENSDDSGNGAIASFVAKGSGTLYQNGISMSYFNNSYFIPYLRGSGALYANKDFYQVGLTKIDFRTGTTLVNATTKFLIANDGTLTAPAFTIPMINTAGNPALITLEYLNDALASLPVLHTLLYPNSTIAFDASTNEQAAMQYLTGYGQLKFDGVGSLFLQTDTSNTSVFNQFIIKDKSDTGVGTNSAGVGIGQRNIVFGVTDNALGSYIGSASSNNLVFGDVSGGSQIVSYSDNSITFGLAQTGSQITNYGMGLAFGIAINGSGITNYGVGGYAAGYVGIAATSSSGIFNGGAGGFASGLVIDGGNYIGSNSDGTFAFGIVRGSGGSNSIQSNNGGSFAMGYISSMTASNSQILSNGQASHTFGYISADSSVIKSDGYGALTFGTIVGDSSNIWGIGQASLARGYVEGNTALIYAGGVGSEASGYIANSNGSISANANASYASGVSLNGGQFIADFAGSRVWGVADGASSSIKTATDGRAAMANGYAENGGTILAQNISSHGEGYVNGAGTISGSGVASWARGWVEGAGGVSAGDIGLAFGHTTDGYISSSHVGVAWGWVDVGSINSNQGGLAYGNISGAGDITNRGNCSTVWGNSLNGGQIYASGFYDLGSESPIGGGNLAFGDVDGGDIWSYFSRGSLTYGSAQGHGVIQNGYDDFAGTAYQSSGSFVGGFANNSSLIYAFNNGMDIFSAFIHGYADNTSTISVSNSGGKIFGMANDSSDISVRSLAGFITGIADSGSTIRVGSGNGGFAGGYATFASNYDSSGLGITTLGDGAFSYGYVSSGRISSSYQGSFAMGSAESGGIIASSGKGSLAMGSATDASYIQASGNGSLAMGDNALGGVYVFGNGSISVGTGNYIGSAYSSGFGNLISTYDFNAHGIGSSITLSGNNSFGIGYNLNSSSNSSWLLGEGYTNTLSDNLSIGFGAQQFRFDANGFGILTDTTLAIPFAFTMGKTANAFVYYNTTDQSTNYEYVKHFWNSNVYTTSSIRGGTGTVRSMQHDFQVTGTTASSSPEFIIKDGHITHKQTTAPTTTVYAAAGTGATCTVVGTDVAGVVTLTSGSGSFSTFGVADINFNRGYANGCVVVFTPSNANAAADMAAKQIYAASFAGNFTINFGVAMTVAGRVYQFNYHVIGK
jgi:hypothetical protein